MRVKLITSYPLIASSPYHGVYLPLQFSVECPGSGNECCIHASRWANRRLMAIKSTPGRRQIAVQRTLSLCSKRAAGCGGPVGKLCGLLSPFLRLYWSSCSPDRKTRSAWWFSVRVAARIFLHPSRRCRRSLLRPSARSAVSIGAIYRRRCSSAGFRT